MKNRIIVVTHKDYNIPSDELYLPVFVGSKIPQNVYLRDNTGDNISEKNAIYCELTAIYWAWKHIDIITDKYIGISHYRRYFCTRKSCNSIDNVLSSTELSSLEDTDNNKDIVFVTPRKIYIQTVENHYIHSKKGYESIHRKDISLLYEAVNRLTPQYSETLRKCLKNHSAHMLNMFIMEKNDFKNYCDWLFLIIDEVVYLNRDREDQRRYAGALSEFLLDVWLIENRKKVKELYLFETEKISFVRKCICKLKNV